MKFKQALITAAIVVAGLGITTGKASAQSPQSDNKNKTEMTVKTPHREFRDNVGKIKKARRAALRSAKSKEERKQINAVVKEGLAVMKEMRSAQTYTYRPQPGELRARK